MIQRFRSYTTQAIVGAIGILLGSTPHIRAQSEPSGGQAHVVLTIDSATVARFDARGFTLSVAHTADSSHAGGSGSSAEIRIVKQAGAYSADLVRLSASGAHALSATVQVVDTAGGSMLSIRLSDVTVMADDIVLSAARDALEQQRISLQESLSQLATEYQQAQRDLATVEELGKSRGSTRLELTQAKEHVADLQQRLTLGRQRQALVTRELRSQGVLDESLVLRFARMEIDSPNNGGHAVWDFPWRAATPPIPPTSRIPNGR